MQRHHVSSSKIQRVQEEHFPSKISLTRCECASAPKHYQTELDPLLESPQGSQSQWWNQLKVFRTKVAWAWNPWAWCKTSDKWRKTNGRLNRRKQMRGGCRENRKEQGQRKKTQGPRTKPQSTKAKGPRAKGPMTTKYGGD